MNKDINSGLGDIITFARFEHDMVEDFSDYAIRSLFNYYLAVRLKHGILTEYDPKEIKRQWTEYYTIMDAAKVLLSKQEIQFFNTSEILEKIKKRKVVIVLRNDGILVKN